MYYLQRKWQTFYLPFFLVHWLYRRKTKEFGFSLVLVILAGVSKAAPYHHITVVVSDMPEKEQKELKSVTCSVHFIQFLTKQTQVTGFVCKICFKLCTIDSNFLKLIQIYFIAPVLALLMTH
jgi:hypothetical protein